MWLISRSTGEERRSGGIKLVRRTAFGGLTWKCLDEPGHVEGCLGRSLAVRMMPSERSQGCPRSPVVPSPDDGAQAARGSRGRVGQVRGGVARHGHWPSRSMGLPDPRRVVVWYGRRCTDPAECRGRLPDFESTSTGPWLRRNERRTSRSVRLVPAC